MRPLSLALLVLLVGPAPALTAGGASVGRGGQGAKPWLAPVAGAMTVAGTERLAALGSVSLAALSTLDKDGKLAFLSAPQVLEPLAAAAQARGHTPESFAALDTAGKLEVLRAAASAAEAEAESLAVAAVDAAAAPLGYRNHAEVSVRVRAAEAVSLYLTRKRREQVAKAAASLKAFERRRERQVEEYVKGLPAKIAAGAFGPFNLIERGQEGWRAADEAPDRYHETLAGLYARRLQRLKSGPLGPWTKTEAALLKATLERPELLAALEKEQAGSAAELSGRLARILETAQAWESAHPGMSAALARFQAGKAGKKDIKAVEEFYEMAASPARFGGDWTGQARVFAQMQTGGGGLPSWSGLQSLRNELNARYHRAGLRGLVPFVAFLVAEAVSAQLAAPTWLTVMTGVGAVLLLVWILVNVWRRDFPLEFQSYLGEILRRYFPR